MICPFFSSATGAASSNWVQMGHPLSGSNQSQQHSWWQKTIDGNILVEGEQFLLFTSSTLWAASSGLGQALAWIACERVEGSGQFLGCSSTHQLEALASECCCIQEASLHISLSQSSPMQSQCSIVTTSSRTGKRQCAG